MGEKGDKLREAALLADEEDALREEQEEVLSDFQRNKSDWLYSHPIADEYDIIRNMSTQFNLNYSDARKFLEVFPKEYTIQEYSIPEIIKQMRLHKRP